MDPILAILVFISSSCLAFFCGAKLKEKALQTNREELIKAQQLLSLCEEQKEELKKNNELSASEIVKLQDASVKSTTQVQILENQLKNVEEKHELEEKQKKDNFKAVAHEIFKEQTERFTADNKKSLEMVLNPLNEKISGFEKKINDSYDKELRDKISLREEIKKLCDLNIKVSDDANQLAKALKGDQKTQGNWGEMILERVLERSGLRKGEEYELQFADINEDGKRVQPDAVVFLPDNKQVVIDAKVSLKAYEAYGQAEEEDRDKLLKDHVASVKAHINGLSDKKYYTSDKLQSPEFVLLFMPIESSFALSVQAEANLFNFAWDKQIVLVSPSTLLATLRTIASIWKQERQNKNAWEIARESGLLYNKFLGFVKDLEETGNLLSRAGKSWDASFRKLQTGPGNLISKCEKIKKLGAQTEKKLPSKIMFDDFTDKNEPS
ncbi:MAG: DNA recombination protein RmuC [Planctomycetes bacterium]|nr:DNA recombination protein RmuC [Planctomycetota bacterium]